MITKPLTIERLKRIATETFYNKNNKVTKAGKGSVIDAILYVCAKLAQKIMANIATLEVFLFPEFATGKNLDDVGALRGVGFRGGSSSSYVWVTVVAKYSNDYPFEEGVSDGVVIDDSFVFHDNNGNEFVYPDGTYTILDGSYDIIKLRSVREGVVSNVNAYSINYVRQDTTNGNTTKKNILSITNESPAFGGMDSQSDDLFRSRIKKSLGAFSLNTIEKVYNYLWSIDDSVVKINYQREIEGDVIYVASESAANFDEPTLEQFRYIAQKFTPFGGQVPKFKNYNYQTYQLYIRLKKNEDYESGYVFNELARNIVDAINWEKDDFKKIEWDNLLQATKDTIGVDYVEDKYFLLAPYGGPPIDLSDYEEFRKDLEIAENTIPHIVNISVKDLNGNDIKDISPNYMFFKSIKKSSISQNIEFKNDFV